MHPPNQHNISKSTSLQTWQSGAGMSSRLPPTVLIQNAAITCREQGQAVVDMSRSGVCAQQQSDVFGDTKLLPIT